MPLSFRYFIFVLLSCFCLFNCAKRGPINGGPKDETPPELLRITPPNKSTNFKAKEIRLTFDELITLDKPDQQILISPPMKNKPEIKPLGIASKTIKIKLLDTLIPNTTYTINFGNSIVDYNEKNPLKFFQYVFSTGNELDSLQFKGTVKDAFLPKLIGSVSVFLYEEDETITDSIVYNKLPRYISSTLDSTAFQFNYLKKGNYKLIALEDKNKNYKFDPKAEKIGFLEERISIPEDTAKVLTIFREKLDFKFVRAKQVSKYKFQIGYQGDIKNPTVEILGKFPDTLKFDTFLLNHTERDSLNFWVKPFFEQDSIVFKVSANKVIDTLVSRYKDQFKDSLKLKNSGSTTLKLDQPLKLSANTPIGKFDENKLSLIDQDSISVDFTQKWDELKNEIDINFPKKENGKYTLQILPNAMTDFLGNVNKDTLSYTLNTLENTAYGNLTLNFSNKKDTIPLIVQLTSSVAKREVILTSLKTIDFKELEPGDFNVKVITDTNLNGKWDTGSYLKKIQPEPVFHFEKTITVRANWDVKQDIILE